MIRKLSLSNFSSFNSQRTVTFIVNEKAPQSVAYANSLAGDRCSKINVFIGPNASGKTNLLKAISFIKYFITDSFLLKPDEQIPFDQFELQKQIKKSTLSVEFELKNYIYVYTVKLNRKRVISESLKYKIKNSRFRQLFIRSWIDKIQKYEYVPSKDFNLSKEVQSVIGHNASVISVTKQFNNEVSKLITDYWNRMVTNVRRSGRLSNLDNELVPKPVELAARKFYEDESLREWADKIIASADLGLYSIRTKKSESTIPGEKEKKEMYYSYGIHIGKGSKPFLLPIFNESSGTQCLYAILGRVLPALKSGAVVVLDEFDNDLHPHITPILLDLFLSKETNPYNAQLLVSTHNIIILRRLDKYQIFVIEKNLQGESDVWRLDDVKGIRSDDNYLNKYEAGAFGGKPNV